MVITRFIMQTIDTVTEGLRIINVCGYFMFIQLFMKINVLLYN